MIPALPDTIRLVLVVLFLAGAVYWHYCEFIYWRAVRRNRRRDS